MNIRLTSLTRLRALGILTLALAASLPAAAARDHDCELEVPGLHISTPGERTVPHGHWKSQAVSAPGGHQASFGFLFEKENGISEPWEGLSAGDLGALIELPKVTPYQAKRARVVLDGRELPGFEVRHHRSSDRSRVLYTSHFRVEVPPGVDTAPTLRKLAEGSRVELTVWDADGDVTGRYAFSVRDLRRIPETLRKVRFHCGKKRPTPGDRYTAEPGDAPTTAPRGEVLLDHADQAHAVFVHLGASSRKGDRVPLELSVVERDWVKADGKVHSRVMKGELDCAKGASRLEQVGLRVYGPGGRLVLRPEPHQSHDDWRHERHGRLVSLLCDGGEARTGERYADLELAREAYRVAVSKYAEDLGETEPFGIYHVKPRPLALGAVVEGVLGGLDEVDSEGRSRDRFTFTGQRGQALRVTLRLGDQPGYIRVLKDERVVASSFSKLKYGLPASPLTVTLEEGGEHVVEVSTLAGEGDATYTLKLERAPASGSPSAGRQSDGQLRIGVLWDGSFEAPEQKSPHEQALLERAVEAAGAEFTFGAGAVLWAEDGVDVARALSAEVKGAEAAARPVKPAVRIAWVDRDRALRASRLGQEALARLKALVASTQEELAKVQDPLLKERAALLAEADSLSEEELESRTRAFHIKLDRFHKEVRSEQRKVNQAQSRDDGAVLAALDAEIPVMARALGVQIIFDGGQAGLLRAPLAADLSAELVRRVDGAKGKPPKVPELTAAELGWVAADAVAGLGKEKVKQAVEDGIPEDVSWVFLESPKGLLQAPRAREYSQAVRGGR